MAFPPFPPHQSGQQQGAPQQVPPYWAQAAHPPQPPPKKSGVPWWLMLLIGVGFLMLSAVGGCLVCVAALPKSDAPKAYNGPLKACTDKSQGCLAEGRHGRTLWVDDALYLTDFATDEIYRVEKDGSGVRLLASKVGLQASVTQPVTDATHLYFAAGDNAIKRIPKGGGAIELVQASSSNRCLQATADGGVSWVGKPEGTFSMPVIFIKPAGGGELQIIQTNEKESDISHVSPDCAFVSESEIYWSSGFHMKKIGSSKARSREAIYRQPRAGGASEKVFHTSKSGATCNRLWADAEFLYCVTNTWHLMRYSKAGGDKRLSMSTKQLERAIPDPSGKSLWLLLQTGKGVTQLQPSASGAFEHQAFSAAPPSHIRDIAVDETHVYWAVDAPQLNQMGVFRAPK